MTAAAKKLPIVEWMTSVPQNVPSELARYYIYWKIFYLLAAIGHLFALSMFWQTGVYFMTVFNIFSVAIFIAALWLLRSGYYRLAFWGAITELTLHGIAATVCVGYLYSFQNYSFLVVILLFIQPFYRLRTSIIMTGVLLASAGMVMYFSVNNPPYYVVPEEFVTMLAVMPMFSWPIYVLIMVLPFLTASARAEKELAAAYGESERLLLNILPAPIADRLKTTSGMIADDHEKVAILFADIVGFTEMSSRLPPAKLVELLNSVFNAIDELAAKYGVEKIKTIGDAYMMVAGLPSPDADPDETIARLALELQNTVSQFEDPVSGEPVRMRIGINSGSVVAGVIGNRKFAYDLWGDAVNVAARMEATSEEARIQVTDSFASSLRDRFQFEHRGDVEIKGKGLMSTSFLTGYAT